MFLLVACLIAVIRERCFPLRIFDFLLDINPQQLRDDYFDGAWQVANRVLNCNEPDSTLA